MRAIAAELRIPETPADREPRPPVVARLVLTDFRCYAELRLAVDPGPIVLTGPNGAGKTNLLEAISFLAPGRGLRRAKLSEIDRRGAAGPWTLALRLVTASRPP